MIGLIGKKLGHSYSAMIHHQLGNLNYQMIEVDENQLQQLFVEKKIQAANVTIPYKQTVLQYLDELDESVQVIGACNTIVYRDGKYIGYNTDAGGFEIMLRMHDIDVRNKKIIVLGNGGASKAVCYVLRKMQAKEIILVKKNRSEETITYEQCYTLHPDAQMIVNTSPVGMYPASDELVINLDVFRHLEAVIDIVYNPLSTLLIAKAKDRGIKACGGLMMLVAQAVMAAGHFQSKKFSDEIVKKITHDLMKEKQNLVLIGMPGCGKSTIAKTLSDMTNRLVIDLDEEIVKDIQMSIKDYFVQFGEDEFRKKETEITKRFMNETGKIISCGGGIVTRQQNMIALHQNGYVVALERKLEDLEVSESRPLSSKQSQLKELYEKRKGLYEHYADLIVENNQSIEETCTKILEGWEEGIEL
ncbi:MAG: shikimate dehydrogenase [Erysipelotrichaceae bacterium]|nr:shikimate dehydrogenase [Erysipelotrichaceae bacterium]